MIAMKPTCGTYIKRKCQKKHGKRICHGSLELKRYIRGRWSQFLCTKCKSYWVKIKKGKYINMQDLIMDDFDLYKEIMLSELEGDL